MRMHNELKPVTRGRVIGLGLGKYMFVGGGVALMLAASSAFAGPEGAKVSSGSAEIRQRGNRTVIRVSDRAVIDYSSFDIGRGERVRFIQPGADSRVLNRIQSARPTTIEGSLKANGRVYIVNPNGVLFTGSSVIDVPHLFAAAGNISNSDFLGGHDHFTGITGDVINQGVIRADTATLIGQHVANTGVIFSDSPGGVVAMVSGSDVTLTPRGGNMSVTVAVPAGGEASAINDGRAAVENSGQIDVRKGSSLMIAGDIYALAIKNTGRVKANDITLRGGEGRVELSGRLDASNRSIGGRGGDVTVTGGDIVVRNAQIDASGSRSGGRVRIGGDVRGAGELANATTTTVDAETSIRADAVQRGDGGSIVVFADDHAEFSGEATARGGRAGGDGGFIETSGKNTLDIAGARVDAGGTRSASSGGKNGQWLLDPTDIVIDTAAATAIVSSLDSGTDVTVETGSTGSDVGNITVDAAITKTAGGEATLTLRAANDVVVNQAVTSTTGELHVNLLANNSAGGNTDADSTLGSVTINNDGMTTDGRVGTNGGDFAAEGVNMVLTGSSTIAGAAVSLRANSSTDQSIGIGAGAGTFNVDTTELGAITADSLTISTTTRNDAATVTALDLTTQGYNFNVRAGSITADQLQVAGGKEIQLRADAGAVVATGALIATGGAVRIQADDLQLDSAGSSITADDVRLTVNGNRTIGLGGSGDFSLSPTEIGNITATSLEVASAGIGNITVGNEGDPTMPIAPLVTDLILSTGGKIDEVAADDNVDIQITGQLKLQTGTGIGNAGTNDGTGTGPLDINAGQLVATVSGAGGIFIKDTGGIDVLDVSTTDGAVSIRSTGALSIADLAAAQSVPSGRTLELVSTGGSIVASGGTVASNGSTYIETTQTNDDISIAAADISASMGVETTLRTIGAGGDATITNTNALTFSDTSVGGNLSATATTGDIFDANTLAVGGDASFATLATDEVIDLNTLDVTGLINADTTGSAGNVNIVNAQGVNIGALNIGGSLGVVATTGNITSTGAITVGDVAGFTTSAADADITLTQLSSSGLLVNTNGSGGDASVASIGPMTFGASAIGGSLTAVATGPITDAAALTVDGAASFKTLNNAGAAITLDNAMNVFGALTASSRDGADAAAAAGNITIIERSVSGNTRMTVTSIATTGNIALSAPDIEIDTASPGEALSAGAGSITLRPVNAGATIGLDAAADFSVSLAELQELSTTGTVTIGATDSGAISIGDAVNLDLSAQTYDFRLRGGATNFARTITLANDRLFTFETGAITSGGMARDVIIGGPDGRLVINTTGPVDIETSVSKLAATTTSGDIDVLNIGTSLEVASIGLINGVTAPTDGDITIGTGGTLTIAAPVAASGTGVVTLSAADGMIDDSGSGTAVTAANIALTSTAGSIGGPGGVGALKVNTSELSANAPGGINIANAATTLLEATLTSDMGAAVLSSGGSISTNGSGWTADSFAISAGGAAPDGVVTINDSIVADNGNISILANDLTINGPSTVLDAGANDVVVARATDGTIGLGNISTEDLNISNEELSAITAANLIVGDANHTTKITVRDVGAPDSQDIAVVQLVAENDNASIAFTGASSTFNGLRARADAGIEVDSNITADTGILSLDADADMAADADAPGVGGMHQDQLFIRSGRTITTQPGGGDITLQGSSGGSGATAGIFAEGNLTIDSHEDVIINSAITVGGTLTLDADGSVTLAGAGVGMVLNITANNGINFAESVTNQSGNLTIDADADDDGNGEFALAAGKTLTTSDGDLSIVASDFLLDGNLNAGTGDVSLTRSTAGEIAIGAFTTMAGRMTISGDELGRITADNLTVGGGSTTAIMVDGVTQAQSMGITGLTTLDAGTTLTFSGAATTFATLRGDADEDITVSSDLTTSGLLTLNADFDSTDSGMLTLSGNITTGNSDFTASGTDLNLTGNLNAGTGVVRLARSAAGNITVDNAPDVAGRMVINDAELQNITAGGLTIGGGSTQAIVVRNFSEADGAGISGTHTFDAGTVLTFNGTSVFDALRGEADDRIAVNGNLTTTVGDLVLDGNADAADDTDDKIEITSGRVLQSARDLTLGAARGGVEGVGSLTLRAARSVTLNSNLTTSGDTIVAADTDGDDDGDFNLLASTTLSTSGSNLTLTAADVVLTGNILTGGGAASIDRSNAGDIAVGVFDTLDGRLTVSGAEIARITATGLTIGGANTTNMTVSGVTDSNSNSIAGTTTLAALGTDGTVTFNGTVSRFNSLSVRAAQSIVTTVNILTDSGAMSFDAGANTASVNDGVIALGANLLASSTGSTTAPTFFDISFNSPVRLRSNVIIESEDATFASRINSNAGSGPLRTLTVNSHQNGTTTFRGNIGGADRLAGLVTNLDGFTRLGGDIFTTRNGMNFNDRVTLIDNVLLRDFGSGILFNNTVNSDSVATPRSLTAIARTSTSTTVNALPFINFTNDVGTTAALRSINLNYSAADNINGRDNVPRVATIIARPIGTNGQFAPITGTLRTFRFVATEGFRMGQNEKMTVAGNLEIIAGTRATLGDLTSLGNMTVTAPSIRILRRAGSSLSARNTNSLTGTGVRVNDIDRGVDFVSGGTYNFSSIPVAVGEGFDPQFGSRSGVRDAAGNLNGFIFQTFEGFANALIDVGSPIVTQDLKSSGPSDTNFATALAGAIPRESRQNDVGQEETISSASFNDLEQLGVFPRDLTDDERVAGLIGWSTYDDYPETGGSAESDFRTAVTRLPGAQATSILAKHQALLYRTVKDPQTGEDRPQSLAPEIKKTFEESIKHFRAQSGSASDRVDPVALREYIERVPEEIQSLTYARNLQSLLKDIELLGLTKRELRKSKSAILRLVRPNGLGTREQFETFLKTDIQALEQSARAAEANPEPLIPG